MVGLMKYLKVFHRDILTVRSHQWKYYVEPYTTCPFKCTYCLYWQSSAYIRNSRPPGDLRSAFNEDLAAMSKKQIVYIGATIDPYQAQEKTIHATRQILYSLIDHDIPIVILTKSPLILRDLDLLQEFHKQHSLLVQFTLLTTNQGKVQVLERGAPSAKERLDAASRLASCGIPVHFHLSPVIPGLYDTGELDATVRAIADNGGQCIYSNILGMRYRNTGVFFKSMEMLNPEAVRRIRSQYKKNGDSRKNVYSPSLDFIYTEMSTLRDVCCRNRIDFICEFMPGLNVFEPSRFENGIFRFGLPAVYQMAQLFDGSSMNWEHFSNRILERFSAVDDEYICLLNAFWDSGQLFDNTAIGTEIVDGKRIYFRTKQMNSERGAVLSWD
jgi:DNA repair photolyase